MGTSPGDITLLLEALAHGDREAEAKLIPLVYDELHHLAAGYMRRERPSHTLQPTALVHEVYLKLIQQRDMNWQNRAQFFGLAAQLMRRILVDHARGHLRDKRGGGQQKISLEDELIFSVERSEELLCLDDALSRLQRLNKRQARIVELRFFGGLTNDETAAILGTSPKTVRRDWALAKAWLYMQLKESYGSNGGEVGTSQDSI
jgi:RNA polymerase sigma factor (TIGR02999 family)